ncbi:MAG: hypothetical protein FXF54_00890 [Kosmotoga sp.]|nr:MAG: hypothetical protein FXF54_00890 [Kosmotoga sp.]
MDELKRLIKWRILENYNIFSRHGIKSIVLILAAAGLIGLLIFPFVFYIRDYFIPNFEELAKLAPRLQELTGVDLKALIVAFLSSVIFVIMLGSDLPVAVSNLFFSDRVHFLLSAPVKSLNIFRSQMLEVLTSGSLPLLLFVPIFLSALSGLGFSGKDFVYALFLLILFIINILMLTTMASFLVVFIARGRMLKYISVIMTAFTLFAFVFTLRFLDFSQIDLAKPQEVVQKFSGFQEVLLSKFLPWTPFVKAIVGNYMDKIVYVIYFIIVAVITDMIGRFFYNKTIHSIHSFTSKQLNNYRMKLKRAPVFFSLMKKEFILVLREPKLAFAFIYPLFFVPIISLANPFLLKGGGVIQLIGLSVFLICNYTTVSSTALFAFERQIKDYRNTFPVNSLVKAFAKGLTIFFVYTLILIALSLYFRIRIPEYSSFITTFMLLLLPTEFVLALFGGTLEKHHGTGEAENVFKSLTFTGAVLSFIFSTLIPVFSSLAVALFNDGNIDFFIAFLGLPISGLYRLLFGLLIPLSLWTTLLLWFMSVFRTESS